MALPRLGRDSFHPVGVRVLVRGLRVVVGIKVPAEPKGLHPRLAPVTKFRLARDARWGATLKEGRK
jgi:hypothetical protein